MLRPLSLLVLLASTSPALAQSRALVKFDLVATDSKGAPVTDLQASEIQIREDGGPRPVEFFRFAGSKHEMAQPGMNEFVNRPGPPLTVVLLDRWNETEATLASAWQDVSAAVARVENVDRLYIYYLANHGELVPVRALPGPENDLRVPESEPASALVAKLNELVRALSGLRDTANIDPLERANKTLQGLGIAGRMAAIAGPKNLVWVTHGFPIQVLSLQQQWVDYTGPLMGLAQMAVRSQVAIYTVDQSAAGAGANVAGLSRQTLELVSAQTGGRWYSSGRAADALTGVAKDALGSYQLAYSSPVGVKGPKEHKLRLESTRKGVHLLTRAGFTGDEATTDPDEIADDVFARQIHSPFEATEIGLRVVRTAKPTALHLEIHVDAADLYVEHRGDRFHGSLSTKLALYHDGTYEDAPPAARQDFDLTQDQYDLAKKDGVVIPRDVEITDKIQQVRVMIFDREIQGLGSVTVPVR
jgi:VWFA-related protein